MQSMFPSVPCLYPGPFAASVLRLVLSFKESGDCVLVLSLNFTNPWSFSPGVWLDWVEFSATQVRLQSLLWVTRVSQIRVSVNYGQFSSMSSGFQQNGSSLTAREGFNDGPVLYSQMVQKEDPLIGGRNKRHFFC